MHRAAAGSSTHRSLASTPSPAGRSIRASPARLPSSYPRARRRDRTARHLNCRAATMNAPSQTAQSGAGTGGRTSILEDAAHHSESLAERTLTRAVVIGGSIAGMFAAAAAAPHFDEVSDPCGLSASPSSVLLPLGHRPCCCWCCCSHLSHTHALGQSAASAPVWEPATGCSTWANVG